jgi:hypothetical protein
MEKDDKSVDLPDELVIPLRKPVTLGSETYTDLVLHEPTGGDMKAAEKFTGIESDIVLIAMVSGVPKPAVEKIGSRDLKKAREYLGGFI